MFKLVVFFVLVAVAAAGFAPLYASSAIIHEPTIAKVGDIVESIPSAVSHQSSTVVHGKANLVTPIVAPALRSYHAPLINAYAAPAYTTYVAPQLLHI